MSNSMMKLSKAIAAGRNLAIFLIWGQISPWEGTNDSGEGTFAPWPEHKDGPV